MKVPMAWYLAAVLAVSASVAMPSAWAVDAIEVVMPQGRFGDKDVAAMHVAALPGQRAQLRQAIDDAIRRNPRNAAALAQRAYFFQQGGDLERARHDFDAAIAAAEPGSVDERNVRWSRGWAEYDRGDYAATLADWQRAVALHGGRPFWTPYSFALLYWATGQQDVALAWYDAAVAANPAWGTNAGVAERTAHWSDPQQDRMRALFITWKERHAAGQPMPAAAGGREAKGPTPQSPPAQWADYLAAIRKADAIENEEARCLATPDLPGNAWRPDAAKWRCSVLRKPLLSLDEIDALLKRDDGAAELDRRFAVLLAGNYTDLHQRDQIFLAFEPFDESARAGEVATRWLQQSPKSAFANAALATHHASAGWKARGEKFARDTSDAQFERMSKEFVAAVPLYLQALKLEPRLTPACTALAAIGRQSSDAVQAYAMDACTKVDPDSYFLALERIYEAQPKWGGSDEALRVAVAYAEARVDRNPMLGALLGESAGYRVSMEDDAASVVDELVAAALMAPSGSMSRAAGRGYRAKGDRWAAIAYLSQALRFWPRDEGARYMRGEALWALGDLDWAYRDMQVALEVEPDDGWDNYRMGQIVRELHGEKEARPYFRHAMDASETRRPAMAIYCLGLFLESPSSPDAANCTRDMVAEFPEYGEGWRVRYWVLRQSQDPGAEQAAEMFLRHADPEDPAQRATVPGVEQWVRMQKARTSKTSK